MAKFLKPHEKRVILNKIIDIPSFADEISRYEKDELIKFIEVEKIDKWRLINELLLANPDKKINDFPSIQSDIVQLDEIKELLLDRDRINVKDGFKGVNNYWPTVENILQRLKTDFQRRLENSTHKERLKQSEIDIYEYLFLPHSEKIDKRIPERFFDTIPHLPKDANFNTLLPNLYEKLYDQIIVNGVRKFNDNDYYFAVRVEAYAKYLHWLKPEDKPKKQPKKTTYVWQNNPDKELPELYSLMKDKYKLIASETTIEQFKAVFTGQAIDEIEPIRWHDDNASELLYFNEAIKNKVNNVWHIYQRMTACFAKSDGKPFDAVFKSLKTNIEINLSPDKQKAIDELVKNF